MENIKNTAPIIRGKYPNQERLSRKFLGNINPKNCFEKNELRAYLKGKTLFSYKTDEQGNPIYYRVRQEYFYTNS